MRRIPLSVMRRSSPPLMLGIAVAAALTAAETLVVYPLRQAAPKGSLGVVYLLGVLVVSSVWGLGLGVVTAVASAAAFDYFHVPPVGSVISGDSQSQAALVIFLAVALVLSSVAALARSRAIEANERRGEADLAAEMARLLLRTDDLRSALPPASARLARTLGLSTATIELEEVAGDQRGVALTLRDGTKPLGTLLVPAELPRGTEARLRERVVPAVEALLRAAREREAMRGVLEASRDELRVLAEEQAALRRVATLVARGTPPEEVFTAVVEEVGRLLPVEYTLLGRYEPDATITFVAAWGGAGPVFPVGTRVTLGGTNLATMVAHTGRLAGIDSWAERSGPVGDALRERGVTWSVGTPIMVEGRLWGLMAAGSIVEHRRPPGTEGRLAQFTELLATAIANAESRAALAASRARIVAAADDARRRIERDLHDRAQQRLVALGLELRAAREAVPAELVEVQGKLSRLAQGLASVFDELREISRGIHPAILSDGGLEPALKMLARRSAMAVELDLRPERRLPEHVEVAVYYVTSEALTNAAKHAHASVVHVGLEVRETTVRLVIRDDGIGGADPGGGSGLLGLRDRIEALGGTFTVISPAGDGTTLVIEIPLEGHGGASPER